MNQMAGLNVQLLLEQVAEQLRTVGFAVELGVGGADGDDIALILRRGDITMRVVGEVRRHLRREAVAAVAARHRALGGRRVLLADVVTPAVAEDLRSAGVQFVDAVGNVFLDGRDVFVWVAGKTRGSAHPRMSIGRPAPTRVLFSLLTDPRLLDAPLRQLASASGVSLGAAQSAVSTLFARGEIVEIRGKRRFANPAAAARRWPEMYLESLRPRLELGRFRARDDSWWAAVDLRAVGAVWSGEVAATKMGTLLRPSTATIYADDVPSELVMTNRLALDGSGAVRFFRKFWSSESSRDATELAPPLLVYADLVVTGDARSLEAAKDIFDTHVLRPFGTT